MQNRIARCTETLSEILSSIDARISDLEDRNDLWLVQLDLAEDPEDTPPNDERDG